MSGSTSSEISRRPFRRRSSSGMVALTIRLAQQRSQASTCLEDVHLGRRVGAVQDLRHLDKRSVLVVVQRHRGALLRWKATKRGRQIEVGSFLLLRRFNASEQCVKQPMTLRRSHRQADRDTPHPSIRAP